MHRVRPRVREGLSRPPDPHTMLLKTILNRVAPQKYFVYGAIHWLDLGGGPARPGGGSRTSPQQPAHLLRLPPQAARLRSAAGASLRVRAALADRRLLRLRDAPRRCSEVRLVVEQVPWGDGKSQLTTTYRWFLAGWAKRLSWREVATAFHTSWDAVYRSVQLRRRVGAGAPLDLDGIAGPRRRRGPVAAGAPLPDARLPDRRRVQAVALGRPGSDRGQPARFLPDADATRSATSIRYLCSDMWKPYLKVLAQEVSRRDPRARPVPHHAGDEPGDRRGASGGGAAAEEAVSSGSSCGYRRSFRRGFVCCRTR